jgi:hypothetical protein
MKNEIIPLEDSIYSIKVDSRNRRLRLLINDIDYNDYFRKSDVLNINNLENNRINRYYCGEIIQRHNVTKINSKNIYLIGCCTITKKQMNYIKSRFKKMK